MFGENMQPIMRFPCLRCMVFERLHLYLFYYREDLLNHNRKFHANKPVWFVFRCNEGHQYFAQKEQRQCVVCLGKKRFGTFVRGSFASRPTV